MIVKSRLLFTSKFVFLAAVIYTVMYIYKCNAPNLGEPVRWDCSSNTLPSPLQQQINGTKVFIGIFSTKEKLVRRKMIRETYLQHKPVDMIYKFIVVATDDELKEEINLYQDILILNMEKENINSGKTYEFFKTISEKHQYDNVDFVLKADDDAYLHLDRIQYDLAHTNRNMSYWGYLVGNTFMAGQCYGLSMDLVKCVAKSSVPEKYKTGHEHSQVQKWFQWSNINDQIKYEVRNCRIHDYIDSGSVYSKPIDLNSTMVVHYLKQDNYFMNTHHILSRTYIR